MILVVTLQLCLLLNLLPGLAIIFLTVTDMPLLLVVWLELLHLSGFCPCDKATSMFAAQLNPWRYSCSQDVGAWGRKR